MTKLFIGALPTTSSTQEVRDYFGQFGALSDAVCMEGRGFGFVTFEDPEAAQQVLSMAHVMGDRRLDLKEATLEGTKGAPSKGGGKGGGKPAFVPFQPSFQPAPAYGGAPGMGGKGGKAGGGKGGGLSAPGSSDKIFVGGLPPDCVEDTLIELFSKYGNLVDVVVMKEKGTGKPRGFGFVQYDNTDSADGVMADVESHNIDGKWIECKRATPQDKMAPAMGKGAVNFGGVMPALGHAGGAMYGGGASFGARPAYGGGGYGMAPMQPAYGRPPLYGGKGGYQPY